MLIGHLRPFLWHPQQKVWNHRLTGRCRERFGRGTLGNAVIAVIVAIDTAVLAGSVARRRASRLRGRVAAGVEPAPASKPRLLYIDCGLHKEGAQVRQMQEWFGDRFDLRVVGFEASPDHIRDAEHALADIDNLSLHQVALVGPDFEGAQIKLFRAGDEGAGDSVFGERGQEFDLVPARRLTETLSDAGVRLDDAPVILRMNIEGAERDVIEDLVAADAHGLVDGFYGMWDDLSKIDVAADAGFRRALRKNGISTITFNDRDLNPHFLRTVSSGRGVAARLADRIFRTRRSLIKRDIETSILVGQARVDRGRGGGR